MYQSEIRWLKDEIKLNGGIEASVITNPSFNGIQILGVKKVPNSRGLHCVFVDLEDYRGNNYQVKLNDSLYYSFSKPVTEVGCHVDIYGSENQIQIVSSDGKYSQVIGGLTFAHTVFGHSSYYVYARFTNSVVQPPPTETEQKRLIREIEERFKRLKEII